MCTSCLFGKATRRPWRLKPAANKTSSKSATAPGQIVSVDQLISSTPGLIAQLKGILTKKRYTVATVFVDQYSGLSYVHLQTSTTAIETLEAKRAFERYAAKHGVTIKHYHADNGRFVENAFVEDVNAQRQTNSFCGVNAHFQNGIAERRIRELQDQARTMLIHANRRWPTAVNAHLWPYALRMANDLHNAAPSLSHKSHQSPFELFTGVKVAPNLQHFKTFGCPVYVLDDKLQGQRSFNKWTERARIGMYLGLSPSHARTVGLVMNLQTGHVSPQFHVKWDNKFETVQGTAGNEPPPSNWQAAAGFTSKLMQRSEGASAIHDTAGYLPIPHSTMPPTTQATAPTQESEGDRDIPSIQSQPTSSTVDMEATQHTDSLVHDDNDLDNVSRLRTST
jgi:hypothetical protein